MRNAIFSSVALALFASHTAGAQCRPPRDSHEARLLAFYAVPIVFTADPTTLTAPRGTVSVSLEGTPVFKPSETLRDTRYCYTGLVQHTDLTPIFGRPRLAIALPRGFGAEVSYVPPITIGDATPQLGSAAIWLTRPVRPNLALTLRTHGTIGMVRGPITCPRRALQQDNSSDPCYGTKESNDVYRPTMFGGEVIAAMTPKTPASRFGFTTGLGVNVLRPHFRVDFSDLLGGRDRTSIDVTLTRVTALAAATLKVSQRCNASAEGYASFGDMVTARGMFGCALFR